MQRGVWCHYDILNSKVEVKKSTSWSGFLILTYPTVQFSLDDHNIIAVVCPRAYTLEHVVKENESMLMLYSLLDLIIK